MTLRDMIQMGSGNLRRLKLRAFLTVAGVVIAIGAFVSMLSFGAGNQAMVQAQWDELGLFTTMLVYAQTEADSTGAEPSPLDESAVQELARLPGVRLAYPYEDFQVRVAWREALAETEAQTVPAAALETKLFRRLLAGEVPAPSDTVGALVGEELLEELGLTRDTAADLIGEPLVVMVSSVRADSGFAAVFRSREEILDRWNSLSSKLDAEVAEDFARREAGEAASRFFDGYMNRQHETRDTLIVRGVLEDGPFRARVRPVVVPLATARRFDQSGPGGDPTQLFPQLMNGTLFGAESESAKEFSQVTLSLDPAAPPKAIADSVAALGFRSFSYATEFEEVRRVLAFFNLGLAAVAFVALATAALGIVNTMLMSISERRREIGILKSLGAQDEEVRDLFLVESALIGVVGSAVGIVLGWIVARVASLVAQEIMRRQDVPPVDLFATPLWLVLTALGFGTVVAVVAGVLPARRAARVDPVRALRSD